MKKRIFAIMLALAMLLAAVPALAEEGENVEAPTVESIKKECVKCKAKVDNVNEQGLCEKCVANLKQGNTQQPVMRSPEALVTDTTGSGEAGGTTGGTEGNAGVNTGSSGDNIDDNTGGNPGNNAGNTDNNGGNTSDNTGESSNPDSTGSSGSIGGDTGTGGATGGSTGGATEGGTTGGGETGGETDGGNTGAGEDGPTTDSCTHTWGDPVWAWSDNYSDATATFKCTRCDKRQAIPATVNTSNEYSNCYVYTKYTAKVTGPDKNDHFDIKTTNCRRPDWYYDPCYYNNPCGHWGCGNVCTRYSNCVPCQNYRTTFRVGGYNCLATPKTGDASVIAPAMLALIGAAGAMLGKKRR